MLVTITAILLFIGEIFPFTLYFSEEPTERVTILSLQGNNPFIFGYDEGYFRKSVYSYKNSLEEGLIKNPETDIVVIPESSNFLRALSFFEGKPESVLVKELLGEEKERLLIYGDYDRDENVSIVQIISNEGEVHSLYKDLLMPLGEYQPYLIEFFAKIFNQKEWLSQVHSVRQIKNVSNAEKLVGSHFGKITALECSEILSPKIYRKIKKEKPDIIFHLQRLASFHGDLRIFQYMLAASKVRAAELRTPIVGSIDGSGYSYVIDMFGVVQEIGTENTKFISAEISI